MITKDRALFWRCFRTVWLSSRHKDFSSIDITDVTRTFIPKEGSRYEAATSDIGFQRVFHSVLEYLHGNGRKQAAIVERFLFAPAASVCLTPRDFSSLRRGLNLHPMLRSAWICPSVLMKINQDSFEPRVFPRLRTLRSTRLYWLKKLSPSRFAAALSRARIYSQCW